jgi:hypothetical protein
MWLLLCDSLQVERAARAVEAAQAAEYEATALRLQVSQHRYRHTTHVTVAQILDLQVPLQEAFFTQPLLHLWSPIRDWN